MEFVEDAALNVARLGSVLFIGCGRGQTIVEFLRRYGDSLEAAGTEVVGVDVSAEAIRGAQVHLASLGAAGRRVTLAVADVLDLPSQILCRKYDLVVDWMCFHELWCGGLDSYPEIVASICGGLFILNTFSVEGAGEVRLPPVCDGIDKRMYSRADIDAQFGQHFDVLRFRQYDRLEHPDPPHPDGVQSAKRAYLMARSGV